MKNRLSIQLKALTFLVSGLLPVATHANINFASQNSRLSVSGGTCVFGNPISNWNGTLEVLSGGAVSGSTIGFSRGNYTTSNSSGVLTGLFDPSGSQKVVLSGSQRFNANASMIIPNMFIGGTANILEGQPNFAGPVTLNTAAAEIQVNITNKLTNNIVMNGGTVTLLNNLALGDDVKLTGSGTVNLNKKTLHLPGKNSSWTSNIFFSNPSDIVLNSKTSLSATWTFGGNGGIGVLNGNGNILDLSAGGTLWIKSGQDVQFTDVHIRGLGANGLGTLVFEDNTSRIRMSNCTLQISSDYTVTQGGFYVEGDQCTILTGSNTLTLGTNFSMTVDDVILFAETLNSTPTVNISPNIPDNNKLIYLRRGIITSGMDSSLVIANSNAINGLLVATSNAVAGLVVANSYAIVSAKQLAIDNSTAITGWVRDTSNAVNGLLVATSNAVAGLLVETSNVAAGLVVANSYAIVSAKQLSIDNSTAITGWVRDTSNAVNGLLVATSNAVAGLLVDTSNVAAGLVVANSYAIVAAKQLSIDNSTAITGWVRDTSNAVNGLLVATSNAVAGLLVETSNVAAGLVVANSYAIVATNSLAIANSNAILALSGAIISSNSLAIDNSNAIVGWVQDTSNAVAGLLVATSYAIASDHELTIANSNAISGWVRDTSNAVFNFVLYNSQAIVTINALNIANSYAIISTNQLTVDNSYAILSAYDLAIGNSNAIIANTLLDVQTSNAVVTIDALARANSNAITGWIQDTSNAVAGLLVATSQAARWARAQADQALSELTTIDHGPAHIHMNANMTMSYDTFISPDHQLRIHTSGVLDGAGHAIRFDRLGTALTLDAAVTVTLQNVVLKDYSDARVTFGSGASLLFGQGVVVELGEAQSLTRTWTFVGYGTVKGEDQQLTLGTGDNYLVVLPNSNVTLKDIRLNNVRDNNIRCMGDASTITLNYVDMVLGSDYTFSSGAISFCSDVNISGTSIFNYTSAFGSTIRSGAHLAFDFASKFNYAPSANFKNLLIMADSSSQLRLTGCTLLASTTGCQLTKGRLIVDGATTVQSAATNIAEGVVFGDGTPANDLLIEILPGAGLQVTSGFLHYNNAN